MSRSRSDRKRLKTLEDAHQSERQAAMMEHAALAREIAAGVIARERARSGLFEGFFEDLAEDARQLLEMKLAAIDDRYRRLKGQLPPAMKS